ncbi:hypothetical protein [Cupriavidus sp. PET2-C1]
MSSNLTASANSADQIIDFKWLFLAIWLPFGMTSSCRSRCAFFHVRPFNHIRRKLQTGSKTATAPIGPIKTRRLIEIGVVRKHIGRPNLPLGRRWVGLEADHNGA